MKKMLSALPRHFRITAGLTLFGILLAILFPSGHRRLAAAAMFLSALGDLALMGYPNVFRKLKGYGFLTGGVLFLLSHLVYAAAFASRMRADGLSLYDGRIGLWLAACLWLFSFVSLTVLSVRRSRFGWTKTLLFALYLTAIMGNCAANFCCTAALVGQDPANAWRLVGPVGIVLFWISDFFIGLDKMAGIPDYGRYIWSFYAPGQLLILLAA